MPAQPAPPDLPYSPTQLDAWGSQLTLTQAEQILGPGLVASLRASPPEHCAEMATSLHQQATERAWKYPNTSQPSVARMRQRRDAYAVVWRLVRGE